MSHYLETHNYDGKLGERLEQCRNFFVEPAETDEKIQIFAHLKKQIRSPTAILAIELITGDIGSPGNYDPTNLLRADDLLFLICKKICKPDLLPLLESQLSDIITSGSCSQGRCTRLVQIFFILYE